MLKLQWLHQDIKTFEDYDAFSDLLRRCNPEVGAMDTETTGLHLTLDKPFVVVLGFIKPGTLQGFTFAVDLQNNPAVGQKVLTLFLEESKKFNVLLGHNLKFDIHMLYNIGYDFSNHTNLADTQHYIRFAHDSLQPSEGGPPLGLKEYAARYVTHEAKAYDKAIQAERSAIAKTYNTRLRHLLKIPLNQFTEWFKDPTADLSDLPPEMIGPYESWRTSLPLYLQHAVEPIVEADMISYTDVNRELLMQYAHYDVKYTIEIYVQIKEVVYNRKQSRGLEIENQLILPFFRMERTGFKVDIPYLKEARIELKRYIRERRAILYDIVGDTISVGQHAKIKDILINRYHLNVQSSGNEELGLLKAGMEHDSEAYQFIELVQELRTLEKWYSAYIVRFLKNLVKTDRLYTQINQVGAVSGRVTSDFQQFPKAAITTVDGVEIFHPRKMVITDHALVYLDYSQIELRVQAFYTMLVGHPDLNMCRAYMPYKCIERNGKYYLEEDENTLWHEVDIHGATTEKATGLKPDDPNFAKLRSIIGKRVNFAKNYGAQLGKIRDMFPDKTLEECKRIDGAYYEAFPGVKEYHKYCEQIAWQQAAVINLFGVYYWNVSGHKLKNLLIQGSAAYFLKLKIIEVDKYLKDKHSKIQMQIHDELSFEWDPRDDFEIFNDIKAIMEIWSDCTIPIIAEMEITTTNWKEKHGI